jgi:hypothetical protein
MQSCNKPGVAQRFPGGLVSQISWHSVHEGGEVVSPTHQPPLPQEMFLVLIFTRGCVDPRAMVRSEGDKSLKNPVTPPGIDPGTIRLVAQRLNHYTTLTQAPTFWCILQFWCKFPEYAINDAETCSTTIILHLYASCALFGVKNELSHYEFWITLPPPNKIVPYTRRCGKLWQNQTNHRRRYNI